ncbi:1-acyl-sn-glycerol-3-phosphate acyltransferase [Biformimicrobium ophioploci]|uniref:Lysophosphatidylcholine acyltransferase n=1 Tax=Biformimicrobium ophioploci TaxID=3036711 RepID=A0ABQ6LYJ5_9GAMM|nr:1-acyl-sn-glycerol-3-phosphate acyltransferase [Microbulbifer sp. NKW57]GMG87139.1 lysophosphatidylcholine acyltransferase [Microbulbifer sp. NKW57]
MGNVVPVIPEKWPKMGNAFTRWIGRTILRIFGWRVIGTPPDRAKFVAAGAPHTSNWDFVFGMSALLGMGVKMNWMGKHTIFKRPFRKLLIRMGGIPVNRKAAKGVVDEAVSQIRNSGRKIIALAPEGTRSRVENWKVGFLRIAHKAQVPILPIGIDYKTRTIRLGELFYTSGDFEEDMARMKAHFQQYTGKFPALAG